MTDTHGYLEALVLDAMTPSGQQALVLDAMTPSGPGTVPRRMTQLLIRNEFLMLEHVMKMTPKQALLSEKLSTSLMNEWAKHRHPLPRR